jgi:hypothetical protein
MFDGLSTWRLEYLQGMREGLMEPVRDPPTGGVQEGAQNGLRQDQ